MICTCMKYIRDATNERKPEQRAAIYLAMTHVLKIQALNVERIIARKTMTERAVKNNYHLLPPKSKQECICTTESIGFVIINFFLWRDIGISLVNLFESTNSFIDIEINIQCSTYF